MASRYALAPQLSPDVAMPFSEAVAKLAVFVGATRINEAGTSVSDFKAQYATVLDRTEHGSLEVITRHRKRYVILEESQVVALTRNAHASPMAADLLADLPLMSVNDVAPPRARIHDSGQVRLGRLPE